MAKLESNLAKIARQVGPSVGEALLETSKDVFDISQQLVPVDKGDLKASGGVEVVSSSHVIVGYGTDHSIFPEYGTVDQAAQPYLTPAFEQNVETFKVRLKEAVKKAVK